MNASNHSTIKIRDQTQNKFFVSYENSFLVLPDGKTVVGPDGSDRKKLMMEDITQGNPKEIGTHGDSIITVLFDSLTQSLLVGDNKGHVKQYKNKNGFFTMVKDYGKVGVDRLVSSTQVGGFAIFGGQKNSLVAINIFEQRVYAGLLTSPFEWTCSLQVCESAGSKVYLSFGGKFFEYFSNIPDYLDMTLLYNVNKKDTPKLPEKMNKVNDLLEEKDKLINSLNLKIKQLELSLQKQVKQNKSTCNFQTSEAKTTRFKSKMKYYFRKAR